MENNQTGLQKLIKPIGFNDSTGMQVYQSYIAKSGFNYMVGVREIQDILIVEQIAEGTACTLLCGVLIYHKESKQLLKEIEVKRDVHYTRAKVVEMVRDALVNILTESCFKNLIEIDIDSATNFINEALDKCYFESSRKSVLAWAKSVGILKN